MIRQNETDITLKLTISKSTAEKNRVTLIYRIRIYRIRIY
jgi:hypothetical protein